MLVHAVVIDHLVGAQERLWDFEMEGFCGQIDNEIELGRLLDWDVSRLCPTQNLVDILARHRTILNRAMYDR